MADTTQIKYVSPERLGYYDQKIKAFIAAADKADKDALQANIDAVSTALATETTERKAADVTNAAAAQAAQNTADSITTYVGTFTASEGVDTVVKYIDAKTANIASDATVSALAERVGKNETDISNLDTNKADKTQVATDIAAAVKAEEDARKEAVAGVQGAVDTLSSTHSTDKAALEGAIALKADQTALEAVSAVANAAVKQSDYDVKVKALEDEDARIVDLVEAEAAKAREEEGKLDARLVDVETFFKTAEGEKLDEALDTLVELQTYLGNEGAVADQMLLDIAANKKAIEDHAATDHDFAAADEALKSELEGKINAKADSSTVSAMDEAYKAADEALEGRIADLEEANAEGGAVATAIEEAKAAADQAQDEIDALEELVGTPAEGKTVVEMIEAVADANEATQGEVDALEEVVATKASQEEMNTVSGKVTTLEGKVSTLEGEMDAVEAAVATKAESADLTALAGRVTTAEGKITTLEGEMDAVEAKASANETAIGTLNTTVDTKASKTDLNSAVDRIAALEAVQHVEITEADIDNMFA